MHLSVKLPCWTPKTNIISYVNYTPIVKNCIAIFVLFSVLCSGSLPKCSYTLSRLKYLANSLFLFSFFSALTVSGLFFLPALPELIVAEAWCTPIVWGGLFPIRQHGHAFYLSPTPKCGWTLRVFKFLHIAVPSFKKTTPNYECTFINTELGTNMRFI